MLIIFIALGEFDNNSLKNKNSKNKNNSKNYKNNNNYKKSQQGGADKNTGNYNQINNETQSKLRNIKNTEIQAELNAKEKMEKGNRGERTVKNIKSGYDFNPADKVLSKERQRRLKLGSDRMKKGFKQGIGPLYKYIFRYIYICSIWYVYSTNNSYVFY